MIDFKSVLQKLGLKNCPQKLLQQLISQILMKNMIKGWSVAKNMIEKKLLYFYSLHYLMNTEPLI